ncbi:hypothetical protein L1887_31723 [Cichorium endivia]|nr:hypothetical protein L1887_31723 [Cichorium endivia]
MSPVYLISLLPRVSRHSHTTKNSDSHEFDRKWKTERKAESTTAQQNLQFDLHFPQNWPLEKIKEETEDDRTSVGSVGGRDNNQKNVDESLNSRSCNWTRPILKGRTEVEQLHKIFKMCGTPSDEYWRNNRLPLAAMFRPQFTYESSLRERCKELPKTVVDIIDTLLCVEPEKRATAKSALHAEYFYTKPYACDPASMPKYPPNKEMDAKSRDATRRRKLAGRVRASRDSRNHRQVHKVVPESRYYMRPQGSVNSRTSSYDNMSEMSQMTESSQSDTMSTLPTQATSSDGGSKYSTKRRNHEERHGLQRAESFYSIGAYNPRESEIYNPREFPSDFDHYLNANMIGSSRTRKVSKLGTDVNSIA